jgi:predicted metalloprotease
MVGGGLGCGSIIIILLFVVLGGDPQALFQSGVLEQGQPGARAPVDPADQPLVEFVGVVLADTEDVWNEQFQAMGREYVEPKLELFSGRVSSACGMASAAVGPFYCPANQTIYIDLSFFRELSEKYGAAGDFARAYVIAHEVGHHVQNLLGTSDRVHQQRQVMGDEEYNRQSVRLELQADYFAGVWTKHAQRQKQLLDPGDIEEAIEAAEAIGDDRLQAQGQGYVVPDSFTHGTSEQRARWFRLGVESGDIEEYDPFQMRDSQL